MRLRGSSGGLTIMVAMLVWSIAAPAAGPATKPAKNAQQAAIIAVQAAVTALSKEYATHQKDSSAPLREKSNYFTENPSTDVTPEAIVLALGQSISPDASADSYVKWQLLSAIPDKFDAKLAPAAAAAYMKAAKPIAHPGASDAAKRELAPYAFKVKNSEEANALNKKLSDLADAVTKRNVPVLAYRDALYEKLPSIPDSLLARMTDGAQRAEAGIDSERIMKSTIDDIALWCSHDAPPAHCRVMAERVGELVRKMGGAPAPAKSGTGGGAAPPRGGYGGGMKGYGAGYTGAGGNMNTFPPKFYDRVEFDGTTSKWTWHEQAPRFVKVEALSDVYTMLSDAAKGKNAAAMNGK